ncbi:arsenate reductase (glutaredoxin) [Tenacibaculum finnmarkense genomovar finnmarkense]|uniref:arsenate reductase (glutaredoxin) n=1 Tax=Tenacibaculum finnmarkense TaxID=2781243 RepID=UPI001E5CE713|nr:arsenate reductase (glutaredoxin) [Tenacibaculum finnmarkense]MCD8418441.1 arsenate reductase (glutaredoxin) [Tenacibaculum finnmarkense genomovar finnmarkense]MCG8186723.1 arsenate reductase (glutaredoxin) [Tenacibaculum finnmarkense genomovar finnmarkense]MCG8203251.1 arsenate reductase (glutaredoxin) [Tenacibaculum finnmarkense genomovar finnmarkense]MCG8210630.1 arsenate reductase (glutaredoxin) [Tenacibaculum finnmarkense genomovar finnmarkense]MCG8213477.1 arsenate reductase (glutared
MIQIYHNPRCSKSRQGLEILENSEKEFEVVKYLENIPSEKQLTQIIRLLNITPIDLVRKNEKIWKEEFKEQFKNNELSDDQLIKAMLNHPKLIERPIVVNADKAVIGRPAENILTII